MTSIEPRVIEDNGRDTFADVSERTINDADMLERLERNLQKAKEMNNIGNEDEKATLNDTETKDNKSKKKKDETTKVKDGKELEVSYAPSFDEVTADNDHLANLRGEGRYFGVADPDANQPTCSNCHRRGHRRAQCKVVVCHACGKVDDHYETQCPNSMVCTNCGEKGHFRNNCPSKRTQTYCIECDSRNHSSDRCPSIWRSYVLRKRDRTSKMAYPSLKIFCYNCAQKGHYGDDCHLSRVSKTPNINGSAFSGDNLPKELIDQYKLTQERDSHNTFEPNNRKRSYDTAISTNYNYAPPPYPRLNRNNNNNNNYNNNYKNSNNNYNNNNNNNNNNNYKNNNNNYNNYNNNSRNTNRFPSGPSKSGYIPMRNNNQQNQRNQGNNNYNNNNTNNYNSRTSYFNNNRNFNRNSRY